MRKREKHSVNDIAGSSWSVNAPLIRLGTNCSLYIENYTVALTHLSTKEIHLLMIPGYLKVTC